MKKLVCLILALLMCAASLALAACKGEGDGGDTTVAPPDGGVVGGDTSTQLGVPEEADFGNPLFTILGYNSSKSEHYDDTVPETDNDTLNDALYKRDKWVQDYLNVAFKYQSINGQWADAMAYSETVSKSVLAGDGAYDLIGAYSLVPPQLAMSKTLLDLSDLPYLDFTKAWWPDFMTNVCTVNGTTYFVSGDISTNLLFQMQGVMVDFDNLSAAGIQPADLVGMVNAGEWTMENFFELSTGMSRDNGDGVWDNSDYYAIHIQDDPLLDSFYFSNGLRLFEVENDALVISKDITDDVTIDIFSLVKGAVYNGDQPIAMKMDLMKSRQCVFNLGIVNKLGTLIGEHGSHFAILPFPKYQVTDKYQTLIGSPHTQFCIPKDVKNQECSAAVMETLAYASYTYVTPEIYENIMQLRFSADDMYSQMFDIMRSGATTDLGILYYFSFYGKSMKDPQSMFRNAIKTQAAGWVSNYRNNYEANMRTVVEQINAIYQK